MFLLADVYSIKPCSSPHFLSSARNCNKVHSNCCCHYCYYFEGKPITWGLSTDSDYAQISDVTSKFLVLIVCIIFSYEYSMHKECRLLGCGDV
jgi:hypothetical protein